LIYEASVHRQRNGDAGVGTAIRSIAVNFHLVIAPAAVVSEVKFPYRKVRRAWCIGFKLLALQSPSERLARRTSYLAVIRMRPEGIEKTDVED
jgi:hypothetical protein